MRGWIILFALVGAATLGGCGGDPGASGSEGGSGIGTGAEDASAAGVVKAPADRSPGADTRPRVPTPPTRVVADLATRFDGRLPPPVGQGSPDGGVHACHVDFNDGQAKQTAMWGAWMDRIYMPWWQACTLGRIDIRPTVHEHVHLNFATLDIVDCLLESPDGYPRRRVNGVCQPIDPASEPRTDISTHTGSEIVLIRGYTADTSQYQRARFDLVRLRVGGQQPVKVCYQPVTQDHLKCFTQAFGPGYYDFSALVTDVVKVEITGATATTFSLDDVRVRFGEALP